MRPTTTQVVWVYGASAAGKQTFIQTLIAGPCSPVAERFAWWGLQLVPCPESIEHVGQSDNDPIVAQRQAIPGSVFALAATADVILIKGQRVDFEARRHEELRRLLPEAHHRLILLQVDAEELARRLVHKWWWDERRDPLASARDDLDLLDETLSQLESFSEITVVDSSRAQRYQILGVR